MDDRFGGARKIFHQPSEAVERLGYAVDIERRKNIELKLLHRKSETAAAATRSRIGLCARPAERTGGVNSALRKGVSWAVCDRYWQKSNVSKVKNTFCYLLLY